LMTKVQGWLSSCHRSQSLRLTSSSLLAQGQGQEPRLKTIQLVSTRLT